MFSPQRLLGKKDRFFNSLLERAADIVLELVKSLRKGMDRCRDAGNVIAHIVLKNC